MTVRPAEKVTLKGLKHRPMWMTHMGCLIACVEHLKIDASPAWVYGASGHAFALNIHEQLCPSGPTAWPAEKCDRLAANFGAAVERSSAQKSEKDFPASQQRIWRQTREALEAGRPCFGWEMNVPEWYVIHGCDAEGNYLFREFDGKVGRTHHTRLGETEIGWACVNAVRRCEPADDRTAVREALAFALEHGAGKHSREKWHTGLSGYDVWIRAFRDAGALDHEAGGFGLAYNAQCWAECRKHAVAFLAEAAKRLDDKPLRALFEEAIRRYEIVSTNLGAVAKAFPFDPQDRKAMDERAKDPSTRRKAIEALTAARDAEDAGLKALARLAKALGAV
jgi:hypothetical protein